MCAGVTDPHQPPVIYPSQLAEPSDGGTILTPVKRDALTPARRGQVSGWIPPRLNEVHIIREMDRLPDEWFVRWELLQVLIHIDKARLQRRWIVTAAGG
ncbi:uncharacterized protein N7515_009317 [Penicillium bovifimosum]|uniref:Uncharacterized protein n=1 Tax=Penicillium bovifimosum TaxID=126998 RepID=A0A9W9KUE2_9EURO|nr:uncharacterized protein N7515_009317 [Penicillium bovifimosum]KAJ5121356.1 hypothetical protein N7515_009317 [Penicillium bovifimosum]